MSERARWGSLSAPLALDVSSRPEGALVTVTGRLDARTSPPLRDLLHRLIGTGTDDVVLDVAEAEIGDGTALGVLVWAHHRARRAGRRLVLANVSARTGRVLRASHLDRVLLGREASAVVPVTARGDG